MNIKISHLRFGGLFIADYKSEISDRGKFMNFPGYHQYKISSPLNNTVTTYVVDVVIKLQPILYYKYYKIVLE